MRPLENAKTINAKPADDPLMEAHENFVRAIRERNS
jgi:hypothetical protein